MQIREALLDKYNELKIREIDLVLDKLKGYYRKNKQNPNGIVTSMKILTIMFRMVY